MKAKERGRWVELVKTSPSGKTLFVCKCCGTVTPVPNRLCPQPVQTALGAQVYCHEWEAKKHPELAAEKKDYENGWNQALERASEDITDLAEENKVDYKVANRFLAILGNLKR